MFTFGFKIAKNFIFCENLLLRPSKILNSKSLSHRKRCVLHFCGKPRSIHAEDGKGQCEWQSSQEVTKIARNGLAVISWRTSEGKLWVTNCEIDLLMCEGGVHCTLYTPTLNYHWLVDFLYTVKSLAIFPSPAGMSLTKLSLGGNN